MRLPQRRGSLYGVGLLILNPEDRIFVMSGIIEGWSIAKARKVAV